MKITIIRYRKDNDFYAKINVNECDTFIAFKVKKDQIIDNGYGIFINNNLLNKHDLLFDVKSQLKSIPDTTFVYTSQIVLVDNSITRLQKFIEVLIKQIKNNYTHYKNSIDFEKECIKKWNEGWKEVIEFEVEYWNGIRQVVSNRNLEIGVEG